MHNTYKYYVINTVMSEHCSTEAQQSHIWIHLMQIFYLDPHHIAHTHNYGKLSVFI